MKSFLVIGMGRFGQHMVRKFSELGCEVMAVDTREDRIRTVMQLMMAAHYLELAARIESTTHSTPEHA